MRQITHIFVHCTAGPQTQTLADLRAEFRRKRWQNPGYHYVIFPDGTVQQLLSEGGVANGVYGWNKGAIHVAYVGGINAQGCAIDNRTPAQKEKLRQLLKLLHKRYSAAHILGHRDISPDKNGNGRVDRWERIKECPCFDAMEEYRDI